METLVKILDENNIDILSNSFVLTSIFFIYDIIVYIITDCININSDNLIIFQFIIGIVLLFIFCFLINNSGNNEDNKNNNDNNNDNNNGNNNDENNNNSGNNNNHNKNEKK